MEADANRRRSATARSAPPASGQGARCRVRSTREPLRWLIPALVVVLLPVSASSASEIQGEDASERLYRSYCAACHGVTGVGDGALAEILEIKPADLTQFSRRNGGIFPFRSVLRAIDGRATVRGHGGSGMPVWGDVFSPEPGSSMQEQLEAFGKLFLITFHLETLQVTGGAENPGTEPSGPP